MGSTNHSTKLQQSFLNSLPDFTFPFPFVGESSSEEGITRDKAYLHVVTFCHKYNYLVAQQRREYMLFV